MAMPTIFQIRHFARMMPQGMGGISNQEKQEVRRAGNCAEAFGATESPEKLHSSVLELIDLWSGCSFFGLFSGEVERVVTTLQRL